MVPHSLSIRQSALTLLRSGVPNAEVSRRLGVPKGTVGHWLHNDRAKHGTLPGHFQRPCPRCDGRELDETAYSYLLGLYLGDGYIVEYAKHRAPSLSIACDEGWPGLINAAEAAMRAVFPDNKTCQVRSVGCRYVKLYSKHLPCLFPQHGPGKKHDRLIALEPWQQGIVDAHPWEFVRGLIHSDGSRCTNWTERTVKGVRKRYEYPRYFFTNRSEDIRRLYTRTLDALGVEWRQANGWNVSVARRKSVELMDRHIGPKH